jgi:hypothetical protein
MPRVAKNIAANFGIAAFQKFGILTPDKLVDEVCPHLREGNTASASYIIARVTDVHGPCILSLSSGQRVTHYIYDPNGTFAETAAKLYASARGAALDADDDENGAEIVGASSIDETAEVEPGDTVAAAPNPLAILDEPIIVNGETVPEPGDEAPPEVVAEPTPEPLKGIAAYNARRKAEKAAREATITPVPLLRPAAVGAALAENDEPEIPAALRRTA